MDKLSKKIGTPKMIVLGVLLAASILLMSFGNYIFGTETIFYIDSPTYAFHELNVVLQAILQKVPAVAQTVIIITFSLIAYELVRIISKVASKGNKKVLTIMSLFLSLLKWVIAIVAILLILGAFGVDTTVLLASAGILTLVIGLGAQSLVADILAGFFLVFEGEYQVGDIVSIDGWRGTVKDIGIRVTRIIDVGGNVKTINNSDVKNVVNQTNELSVAKLILPIDYGESLERVEVVLKDNLERIAKEIPDIIEGPFYKGVAELGESSVNLLVIAKCNEENIYQVQRDMLREFYIVFNKNNISVPFNQVVLSYRGEESEEKVSKKIEKEAREFLEEQKELTKTILTEDENSKE